MAKRAHKSAPLEAASFEASAPARPAAPAPRWDAGDPDAYRPSPARALQLAVDAVFAGEAAADAEAAPYVDAKWSARRSLAFMVGVSGALWAGLGAVAFLALK